ncbi:unnamed protein product [Rotaria sp. Silwood1]|nr:unnamed protein product [Rotaria sp. Silwood1]CAF3823201.1 unnamed protein product [Rotaria sp. Silwood1]CAF4754933.1 unnamed protein product [Rotaria sp. Silwood1]CAF4932774.1 unnamed protein product [Rotaria sp. Silwood1]
MKYHLIDNNSLYDKDIDVEFIITICNDLLGIDGSPKEIKIAVIAGKIRRCILSLFYFFLSSDISKKYSIDGLSP